MDKEKYIQYGGIGLAVIVVLLLLRKSMGGTSYTQNVTPVTVQYQPSNDPNQAQTNKLAGFQALTAVANQVYDVDVTKAVSQDQLEGLKYGYDTQRAVAELEAEANAEYLRIAGEQRFREMQFGAQQLYVTADAYRRQDIARQANVLNAMAAFFTGQSNATGYTYPQSSGGATGIINGLSNLVGRGLSIFGL